MLLKLRHAVLLSLGFGPALLHGQTTRSVPSTAYPTIQSAINASAMSGDTVQVTVAQTYNENISFMGKNLLLTSAVAPGAAILNGSGFGPVVTISGATAAGATLSGFTIMNGGKPQTTGGPQGAIYVSGTIAHITGNTLVLNYCAGINAVNAVVIATGNDIGFTQTTGCAAAEGLGSAIAMTGTYTLPPSIPPFPAPIATLSGNTIHQNLTSVAYSVDQGGGAGINITNLPSVIVSGNLIAQNTTTGLGGAVYIATTPSVTFENNVIFGNTGLSGGLEFVSASSSLGPVTALFANNTFASNKATTATLGSDVDLTGTLSQVALVNNIIVGYVSGEAAVNCATNYLTQTLTPLILDHNDLYAVSGATSLGGYCAVPTPAIGNISQDPLFVHGTSDDFAGNTGNPIDLSLQAGSPAIDAGNNSATLYSATDYAGGPRIRGFSVDIGAYEYGTTKGTTISTVVTLTPATYDPTSGSTLALTATVAPKSASTIIPTGSVRFVEDGTVVGTGTLDGVNTPGTATFTLPSVTAGLHHLQAVYQTDGTTPPGTSVDVIISGTVGLPTQTTTVINSSANPSTLGQNVTFTAHVTSPNGIPTGQVTFTAYAGSPGPPVPASIPLGTSTLDASGNATASISTLSVTRPTANPPVPPYTIVGVYTPTGAYVTSTGTYVQSVNGAAADAVLTVNPLTSNKGDSVTLTVNVTPAVASSGAPTPGGNITFYSGILPINTVQLVNGAASLTTTTLIPGNDSLGCQYAGDSNYSPAECNSIVEAVGGITTTTVLTSIPNPSYFGESVQFVATVTPDTDAGGAPTGSVQFFDNGVLLDTEPVLTGQSCGGCPVDAVKALFTISTLAVGSHPMSATFIPSNTMTGSTGTETQVVNSSLPSTLAVTASANPVYALTPFTITMSLTSAGTPLPNTAITYTLNGVAQPTLTTDATGHASFTLTEPTGTYVIDAHYNPTTIYESAEGILTENVLANPTSISMNVSPNPGYQGQTIAIAATVTDTTGTVSPNGTVTVSDGGTTLATLPTGASVTGSKLATVTFSGSAFAVGDHSLTATFTPADGNFLAPAPASQTLTILPSDITLTTSVSSTTIETEHHGSITLTAASIGNWNGALQLACGPTLPPLLTCTFAHPVLQLQAGGAASTSVELETDALADFATLSPQSTQPHGFTRGIIAFATLLPLTLLRLARRRRWSKALSLAAAFVLVSLFGLSGCSGKFPAHTPPGTYDIPFTAMGTSTGTSIVVAKTVHLTLVVTP